MLQSLSALSFFLAPLCCGLMLLFWMPSWECYPVVTSISTKDCQPYLEPSLPFHFPWQASSEALHWGDPTAEIPKESNPFSSGQYYTQSPQAGTCIINKEIELWKNNVLASQHQFSCLCTCRVNQTKCWYRSRAREASWIREILIRHVHCIHGTFSAVSGSSSSLVAASWTQIDVWDNESMFICIALLSERTMVLYLHAEGRHSQNTRLFPEETWQPCK